jgi:hypothetical protein
LIKLVQNWKVELVTEFFNVLYYLRMRQDGAESIWWIPSKRRKL